MAPLFVWLVLVELAGGGGGGELEEAPVTHPPVSLGIMRKIQGKEELRSNPLEEWSMHHAIVRTYMKLFHSGSSCHWSWQREKVQTRLIFKFHLSNRACCSRQLTLLTHQRANGRWTIPCLYLTCSPKACLSKVVLVISHAGLQGN